MALLSPSAPHLTPNFLHTREVLLALWAVTSRAAEEAGGELRSQAEAALALYDEWRSR